MCAAPPILVLEIDWTTETEAVKQLSRRCQNLPETNQTLYASVNSMGAPLNK